MNWFRKLFAKPPQPIDDPDFGTMTFENGIWTSLPNSTSDYMINVVSDCSGPADTQRRLFRQFRKRADSLVHDARAYIDLHTDKPIISVDTSCLTIYGIVIGDDAESARSELTLELSDVDAHVIQCVAVRDWNPIRYWIED